MHIYKNVCLQWWYLDTPPQHPLILTFLLCRTPQLSLSHIITEDEMNGIIHRQEGVVVTFLNRIYEVLTQRKYVPPPIPHTHHAFPIIITHSSRKYIPHPFPLPPSPPHLLLLPYL